MKLVKFSIKFVDRSHWLFISCMHMKLFFIVLSQVAMINENIEENLFNMLNEETDSE